MTTASVLVGLIGSGIQASRTPRMHELEGDAHGLRYLYKLIDLDVLGVTVDALPELVLAAERLGFSGLNITFPCKQAVLPLLDDLSPEAGAIGAVNTVLFRAGRRIGHNTDCSGFAASFRGELGDVPHRCAVLLGAGGAGAAVSHALLTLGIEQVIVVDVEALRAVALTDALCARFGAGRARVSTDLATDLAAADGLINATPIGMAKFPGTAVPAQLLSPRHWLVDLIYFPLETELLRAARSIGCKALSGAGMAVHQAADAFQLFTGQQADVRRMSRTFSEMSEHPGKNKR
jgi:shikimate dehydrogenase